MKFKKWFAAGMLALATVIVTLTIADALAASLKVWTGGETVRAADLNSNFSILSGTINGVTTIARGGTAGTVTPTAGAVAYGRATSYGFTAAPTNRQMLLGAADAGAPSWGPRILTGPAAGTVMGFNNSIVSTCQTPADGGNPVLIAGATIGDNVQVQGDQSGIGLDYTVYRGTVTDGGYVWVDRCQIGNDSAPAELRTVRIVVTQIVSP